MIAIFKNLRIIYYLVSSGIGVLLAVVLVFSNVDILLTLAIVILWVLFWAWFFNGLARKKSSELLALRNQCNGEEFVKEYGELLPDQKKGSVSDAIVKLNLAAGYMDIGELRKAFETLSQVRIPNKGFGANANALNAISATYHSNFSLAFLKEGNIEKAVEALNSCRRVLANSKIPEKERERFQSLCNLRQAQIGVVMGNLKEIPRAEALFEAYRNRTQNMLDKVTASYWLARISYLKGDKKSERKHLQFAASYGGDSYCAREARTILERNELNPEMIKENESELISENLNEDI